jgi:hypothetical protein
VERGKPSAGFIFRFVSACFHFVFLLEGLIYSRPPGGQGGVSQHRLPIRDNSRDSRKKIRVHPCPSVVEIKMKMIEPIAIKNS